MFVVPLIAWLAGFGWACFGIMVAASRKSIENFNYIVSAVLTPLFLVAGTFFPLNQLPRWAQVLGEINPLHHCVQLVRDSAFGVARLGRPAPRRRPAGVRAPRSGGSRSSQCSVSSSTDARTDRRSPHGQQGQEREEEQ